MKEERVSMVDLITKMDLFINQHQNNNSEVILKVTECKDFLKECVKKACLDILSKKK